jgi:O-antigen/teichoic acid export membrane protein
LNISNFILTISASLAILYLFPFTLYGPILGRLIPALITSAIAISLLGHEYGLSWDKEMFNKLIRYSSPILLYALLTWIITYIDRFIILRIMGDAALVGVFDIAVKIVIGLDLVLTGLINTINPKVYAIWKTSGVNETTPEINRYYNGLTGFLLLSIPLFVFVVPLIIPLVIFKPIYYQAFEFLPILAAGYATRVWFFMFLAPIMFFKKTAALPRVLVISAIFDILLGIIMIKYFGLMGAVWTNFLIKPLQAGLMYLECRKIYTLKVNFWKIFYTPMIFIAVVIVSELAIPAEFNLLSRAVQLMAAGTLVFFAFRKELPNSMAFLQKGSKHSVQTPESD